MHTLVRIERTTCLEYVPTVCSKSTLEPGIVFFRGNLLQLAGLGVVVALPRGAHHDFRFETEYESNARGHTAGKYHSPRAGEISTLQKGATGERDECNNRQDETGGVRWGGRADGDVRS